MKMEQKRPKSYLLPLSKDTYNWSKGDIGKQKFLKTTLDGVKTHGYLAKKGGLCLNCISKLTMDNCYCIIIVGCVFRQMD